MRSTLVGHGITLWLVVSCLSMPAAIAAGVSISFPAPGSNVNVGTLVEATLDSSIDPATVQSVSFEYSTDLLIWTPITAPAPDGVGDFSVLWKPK